MTDSAIGDESFAQVDLPKFLDELSVWMGGMSLFIAASKREWHAAPTGYHLMAQRLRKLTLDLERDAKALSVQLKANKLLEKDVA